MVCSPEYAHGVSGVMKNALDWLVGSGELAFGKPVGVINASATSKFADPQLREILKTMDANVVADASVSVPVQGKKLDEYGIAADPILSETLKSAIASLATAIRTRQTIDLAK
jgi:NAD(P)H-dependent FMN reductase